MKKKTILTIVAAVFILLALYWVFWLMFYYDAVMNGPILVDFSNDYIRFEHDYLVPLQIFGITFLLTILTFGLYPKLKKQKKISGKYIVLAVLSTVPFWYVSIFHLCSIINNYETI